MLCLAHSLQPGDFYRHSCSLGTSQLRFGRPCYSRGLSSPSDGDRRVLLPPSPRRGSVPPLLTLSWGQELGKSRKGLDPYMERERAPGGLQAVGLQSSGCHHCPLQGLLHLPLKQMARVGDGPWASGPLGFLFLLLLPYCSICLPSLRRIQLRQPGQIQPGNTLAAKSPTTVINQQSL